MLDRRRGGASARRAGFAAVRGSVRRARRVRQAGGLAAWRILPVGGSAAALWLEVRRPSLRFSFCENIATGTAARNRNPHGRAENRTIWARRVPVLAGHYYRSRLLI